MPTNSDSTNDPTDVLDAQCEHGVLEALCVICDMAMQLINRPAPVLPDEEATPPSGLQVSGYLTSIEHGLNAAPGTPDNELGRQALASLRAAGLGAPTPKSDANKPPQESALPVQSSVAPSSVRDSGGAPSEEFAEILSALRALLDAHGCEDGDAACGQCYRAAAVLDAHGAWL